MTLVQLLEVDPDLAAGLPAEAVPAAEQLLTVAATVLEPGEWDPSAAWGGDGRAASGMLVIDGLLARDLVVANRPCRQLLGPGHPILHEDDTALLPMSVTWTAILPTKIAILGSRWLAAVARWPQLAINYQRRLDLLARRMATHQAISQLPRVEDRLLALLLHLAEDWGRMTLDGVVVSLPLTHAELGRLAGARRPTVSLALAQLEREGALRRMGDGGWHLDRAAAETWGVPAAAKPLGRPARPARAQRATDGSARPPLPPSLAARLTAVRAALAREAARTPELLKATEAALAASREIRLSSGEARERRVRSHPPAP